jgi:hypothetical protein
METTVAALTELLHYLQSGNLPEARALIGFDGFVDKIKRAVRERTESGPVYFNTIREFSDRILAAAGKSGQVEMDTRLVKAGGNAPILASALGNVGIKSWCIGSMGYPKRHDVFSGLHANCETVSILNPGLSDAIEFEDGKLIFSELDVFNSYTWSYIVTTVGRERITQAVSGSSLLAFVDWANLPHATGIWEGMLHDIIKPLQRKDFIFFFDVCDPSKKTPKQIDEMLDLISAFSPYGRVILGVNENETIRLYAAVRANDPVTTQPTAAQAADYLYRSLNIDTLVMHPIDRIRVCRQHEAFEFKGHLVTNPKVATGGGDNLNAGFCLGLLAGLTIPQCMLLGMAASGAYVEQGSSPTRTELIAYIERWILELNAVPVSVRNDGQQKSPD